MPNAPKQFRPPWMRKAARESRRQHDQRRGSARERGYTRTWEKERAAYLAVNPLCKRCMDHGKVTAASLVDHVVPVEDASDPLFWEVENWQPLCRDCHAVKTGEDRRAGKTRRA